MGDRGVTTEKCVFLGMVPILLDSNRSDIKPGVLHVLDRSE